MLNEQRPITTRDENPIDVITPVNTITTIPHIVAVLVKNPSFSLHHHYHPQNRLLLHKGHEHQQRSKFRARSQNFRQL